MEIFTDPQSWIALLTLSALEIVLGIDNIVFISILAGKLPGKQAVTARQLGIGAALITRILLLLSISWIVRLTQPLFTIYNWEATGRDLILIAGGLFLVWKATKEIHHNVDPDPGPDMFDGKTASLGLTAAIGQILLLDIVFSIDSIITAVGMTEHIPIMVIAVIVAVLAMLLAADPLAKFIHDNPTIVMLALGFLLMIGTTLIADGFGAHVPRGYVYAAMAFSAFIEGLNMLARRAKRRRRLRDGAAQSQVQSSS